MEATFWYLAAGVLLCAMALAATLIRRLPLSTAMLYLPIGWALGPNGYRLIHFDLKQDAHVIEQVAQVIILLSIFSAGLKMRVPITSRLWLLSLRLAFLSMIITVALIAVAGVYLFHLPWGLAILIGGILAPTDPVLAADVQVESPYQFGALRFGLTSEAGLNDGSAFPFVILGLILLTTPLNASGLWKWFAADFVWATIAGIGVGVATSALLGKFVLHLRTGHRQAVGLGYFLAPGLIALTYALGELVHGYGFLSVFASAVTLRWIEMKQSAAAEVPKVPWVAADSKSLFEVATNPGSAPVFLVDTLLHFTSELEQIGELVIVIMVGALLAPETFALHHLLRLLLLFLVIRPLAIFTGLAGSTLGVRERGLIGWFGIRGIGSVYYLAYAIQHGFPQDQIEYAANAVLAAIAISVLAHGISVTPLMNWYSRKSVREKGLI